MIKSFMIYKAHWNHFVLLRSKVIYTVRLLVKRSIKVPSLKGKTHVGQTLLSVTPVSVFSLDFSGVTPVLLRYS